MLPRSKREDGRVSCRQVRIGYAVFAGPPYARTGVLDRRGAVLFGEGWPGPGSCGNWSNRGQAGCGGSPGVNYKTLAVIIQGLARHPF